MPRGKGKRRASQQENQRDKIKIQNVKKRKREDNRQYDKQAKRRKIEWFRDIRSILRSSGKKVEFPEYLSERKLNKIQKEKKCLGSNSLIRDSNQPGPSGRSRDNFINTMIELEYQCASDLDLIESISSGSSLVEVIDEPFIDEDNEIHTTRRHDLIDQEQGDIQTNNLIDQIQKKNQSNKLIDQAQRNSQFDNVCTISDSFQNFNGSQQTTDFKAAIEIRSVQLKNTDNTIIEDKKNVNIGTTNCDVEPFILPSTELIDKSNSNKYVSSADQNKEWSGIQVHNNNMESGDHSHNLGEESLSDSSNYWNFNTNRGYNNDRIFYFGSAMNEKKIGSNVANFSFASHSNNLSDNQDILPDGDSRGTVNNPMEVDERNTVHLQEREYNNNNYANELNRNAVQTNDLSKCLLHPTDTLVYNTNNQHNSENANVNNIDNFHHQNSFAYYDNSTGAFLKSSSLQNNSSTSQSLKNTWGSIKNLLSRVSGQKSNDNQQTEEGNDPEGSP